MKINYFFEGVEQISTPLLFENWVYNIEQSTTRTLSINYIFVDKKEILRINKEYLQHDYYTDIITFDLSEGGKDIKSDIFISLETVQENADDRKIPFENELTRVMVHGILHLIGYNDKTEQEQKEMTRQENIAIEKILNVSRETNK